MLGNAHGCKVSFFCRSLNQIHNLIGQSNLRRDISAVIYNIVQRFLNHICQILRQHLGSFRLVNGRNRLTGFRDGGKLAI